MEVFEEKAPPHSPPSPPPEASSSGWRETFARAQRHTQALCCLLPADPSIASLPYSDSPARSLLNSEPAFGAVSFALSEPDSGTGDDPLCRWLYDAFQTADPTLRLVVLSYLPLLAGLYILRVNQPGEVPCLAGFEAVLLALYASEGRGGKPGSISLPDLSRPSIYHSPAAPLLLAVAGQDGEIPELEPQIGVKSGERAGIIAVALHCYHKKLSRIPSWSKLYLCQFASAWATQKFLPVSTSKSNPNSGDTSAGEIEEIEKEPKRLEFGETSGENRGSSEEGEALKGWRVALPFELLQPVLGILAHCLLAPKSGREVKQAAEKAVQYLHVRAALEMMPEAILATRSLMTLKEARESRERRRRRSRSRRQH